MLGKLYINDQLLGRCIEMQAKYGKQMKNISTRNDLKKAIEILGYEVIEIREDYQNKTIIIKTKTRMSVDDKENVKESMAIFAIIQYRTIFYSEEDI